MGEPITAERAMRLFGVYLNNVDLTGVSDDLVEWAIHHPKEAGEQMGLFLRNRGKVMIGEPKVITIGRSQQFDPAKFIGKGWTIWKGPIDGDGLKGDEEQDSRSLALTELDLSKVRFETGLTGKETSVKGETKLARLKEAGHIRLDAKTFQTFWENQHLIPLSWKEKTNGNTTCIFFDGTVLRSPNGFRYVLDLCWGGDAWLWGAIWLEYDWDANYPSAVLASES